MEFGQRLLPFTLSWLESASPLDHGFFGAFFLFLSVLIHELARSYIARREVMKPIREEILLDPDGEVVDALQKMIRTGEGRLPVVKDGKAAGMITRRDILNLLEIKADLME
jgi:predicted transcriptional regulator